MDASSVSRDAGSTRLAGAGPRDCSVFTPRATLSLPSRQDHATGRYYAQVRRRAEILAVTRDILAETGCESIKIRHLAQRSGVTPPTIYNLVGARKDVLRQAIREALRGKLALAIEHASVEGTNPLLAYAELTWRSIANDPSYYHEVTRAAFACDLDRSLVIDIHRDMANAMLRWLTRMSEAGELRPHVIALATIANAMALQNEATITNWMRGDLAIEALRHELIAGAALMLLGIAVTDQVERIERWLEQRLAAPGGVPTPTAASARPAFSVQ